MESSKCITRKSLSSAPDAFGLSQSEADEEITTLRDRLESPDLNITAAAQIAKRIARHVVADGDPTSRMAELTRGPYETDAHSNAARLEYNALVELVNSHNTTVARYDAESSAGITLALINTDAGIDVSTGIESIQAQVAKLAGNNKEAIKEFLAQQAVLSSHVGQHTIQQSVDAPTVEASALTAKYGIQMLESAARITERLARIDQPRQGNVFATQANVGVNQQIVNDRPRTVRSDV